MLDVLHAHEAGLRERGVAQVALFGLVARGETRADSDIDVLVAPDPERPIGLFEYARLKLYVADLLDGSADMVNRNPQANASRCNPPRRRGCLL